MQLFREVLDECNFMDLGFKGFPFTWSKHYRTSVSIWERLDRAIAMVEWFSHFPGTWVHHVDSTTLDHKLYGLNKLVWSFNRRRSRLDLSKCGWRIKGVGKL